MLRLHQLIKPLVIGGSIGSQLFCLEKCKHRGSGRIRVAVHGLLVTIHRLPAGCRAVRWPGFRGPRVLFV